MSTTNPRVVANAESYLQAHADRYGLDPGVDLRKPSMLALDPELGKKTALLYHRMSHRPEHQRVKASYDAMKRETLAQYLHLVRSGVQIRPWLREGQPYKNSDEMRKDVAENNRLFYFPSVAGYGQGEDIPNHPLLERTGQVVDGYDQTYNDLFRAVHDYFGHAMHGHQFGPQGELRAWAEHARMYSPAARPALSAETHGQNSWVNFGPHRHLPVTERPYAEQKATVLPRGVWPERLGRKWSPGKKQDAAVKRWLKRTEEFKNLIRGDNDLDENFAPKKTRPGTVGPKVDRGYESDRQKAGELISLIISKRNEEQLQGLPHGELSDPYREELADHLERMGDPLAVVFRRHRAYQNLRGDRADKPHMEAHLQGSAQPKTLDPSGGVTGIRYYLIPHGDTVSTPYPVVNVLHAVGTNSGGFTVHHAASAPVTGEELHQIIDKHGTGYINTDFGEQAERKLRSQANQHGENNPLQLARGTDDEPRASDGKWTSGGGGGGASRIVKAIRGLPAKILSKAKTTVVNKYKETEQKYGKTYARLAVGALVAGLPVPAPGASMLLMGTVLMVAKLHTGLAKRYGNKKPKDVDEKRVKSAASWLGRQLGIGGSKAQKLARIVSPDGTALHQTAAENNTDRTPHLVLADWLEEHGQPATAEFIRRSVEGDHPRLTYPASRMHDDIPHGLESSLGYTRASEGLPAASHGYQTLSLRSPIGKRGITYYLPHDPKSPGLFQRVGDETVRDDEEPTRLARRPAFRTPGPSAALSESYTVNADKRREIAQKILREAGLTPAVVRTVLAHEPGKGVRTSVIQAITKRLDPGMARYVAAWWGLLAREKAVTVFHPDDQGGDQLHVITDRLPVHEMGEYLSQAGLPSFSIEESPHGSRAFIFNPQGELTQHVRRILTGLPDANHSSFRGSGFRLGSGQGSDADARAHYRKVIADYEATVSAHTQAPRA